MSDRADLRIESEMAALEKSRKSGPAKKAEAKELRREIDRTLDEQKTLLDKLAELRTDARGKLRDYSYSSSAGATVAKRAAGFDEYSQLPGGAEFKVKEPSIDHLFSVDRIFELDKFWELFEDDQKEILSLDYNLKLMEKDWNSSKGGGRTADWEAGRRHYGEERWRKMAELERKNGELIQAEVYRRYKIRRR